MSPAGFEHATAAHTGFAHAAAAHATGSGFAHGAAWAAAHAEWGALGRAVKWVGNCEVAAELSGWLGRPQGRVHTAAVSAHECLAHVAAAYMPAVLEEGS